MIVIVVYPPRIGKGTSCLIRPPPELVVDPSSVFSHLIPPRG